MPQVAIAVAAAAAGAGASSAVGGGIAGALLAALTATAVTYGGNTLLLKPAKAPSLLGDAEGLMTTVRSSVEPHKIIYGERRVGGVLAYMGTTDETKFINTVFKTEYTHRGNNAALHMVIALAGHEVEEIGDIYFDDELVALDDNGDATDKQFIYSNRSTVRIKKHLGSVDQEADPTMIDEIEEWTENHRLRGVAYLYIRLIYNRNIWPSGIPKVTAVVKGKKVYDPRSQTTEFSDNWALCVRDYITNGTYGLGATADEIDDASVIAAANTCDEAVPLRIGGVHKRYTCNGVVDTGKKPLDVLNEMMTAASGIVTYAGGRYKVHAAAYDIPVVEIDESWLRGEIEFSDRPSQKDVFNTARGVYIEPAKIYQPADLPVVTNQDYIDQDKGRVVSEDFELPFTTNVERGQRLLRIALNSVRQSQRIALKCNQKAMQLQIHDVVMFTSDALGLEQAVYRVVQWALNDDGSVNVGLKQESPEVYAFNPATDITLLTPSGDVQLPNQRYVAPPGAPQITEDLIETTGAGGLKPRVTVTWSASDDAFAVLYTIEYRLVDTEEWTVAGDTKTTRYVLNDMQPGVYEFRVMASSSLGVESEYSTKIAEVLGLAAPPADIANLSLNTIGGNAHLVWDQVPDLDVKAGGKIRLRFTKDPIPTWSKGHEISEALPGIATTHVVPLVDGTYMAKAVDSAGNESQNATMVTAEQTDLLNMNVVKDLLDDNTNQFPGLKTNLFYDESVGVLRLDSSVYFDEQPGTFDATPGTFDATGAGMNETYGEYVHSETFDLGYIGKFRVVADLRCVTYDEAQSFDATAGNFDSRSGRFDGDDIASVGVKIMVRTTNDDPDDGGAVWSSWRAFIAGEFRARGAQFKIVINSTNGAHNMLVESLNFNIDMPDITLRGTLTTSDAADVSAAFTRQFNEEPKISFAINGMQTGDYIDILNLTTTGFDVAVRNGDGYRVVRDITYIAVGY